MLGSKATKYEAITIPARIAKRLSLKDGAIIEAKVEKGKLFIIGRKDKTAKMKMLKRSLVKYAMHGADGKRASLHRYRCLC